jgi:hypothetical protein
VRLAVGRRHGPSGGVGVTAVRVAVVLSAILPALAVGLEPRFDHRDQQGPTAELLAAKDVIWHGSSTSTNPLRGAVRVAWGFDPAGDGDEVFLGATFTALNSGTSADERVRLTFDARYRACLGTDELKTLLDIGIWVSAADPVAVGPLVGFGLMYDFSRNFGLLTSAFLGAGIGQSRVVSFGGGMGFQYRFE